MISDAKTSGVRILDDLCQPHGEGLYRRRFWVISHLMEQRRLGGTGLTVSRLGLGTMTWGRDTDEHEAKDQLVAFVDAGGTFVDTADVYADGAAERVLGGLIGDIGQRDSLVIATKAASRPGTERRFDASRSHLLASLDASLKRLGTDYVDVWQLHAWDPMTPFAESLSAADEAVRMGKARYIGISNYSRLADGGCRLLAVVGTRSSAGLRDPSRVLAVSSEGSSVR